MTAGYQKASKVAFTCVNLMKGGLGFISGLLEVMSTHQVECVCSNRSLPASWGPATPVFLSQRRRRPAADPGSLGQVSTSCSVLDLVGGQVAVRLYVLIQARTTGRCGLLWGGICFGYRSSVWQHCSPNLAESLSNRSYGGLQVSVMTLIVVFS